MHFSRNKNISALAAVILTSFLLPLYAAEQSGVKIENFLTDVNQFIDSPDNSSNLIDNNPNTIWRSNGKSLTISLPESLIDGDCLNLTIAFPSDKSNAPTAFTVYGVHLDNGVPKESVIGYTSAKIDVENIDKFSLDLWIRNGFNEWWKCDRIRFECSHTQTEEIPTKNSFFELGGIELYKKIKWEIKELELFSKEKPNGFTFLNVNYSLENLFDKDLSNYKDSNDLQWIHSSDGDGYFTVYPFQSGIDSDQESSVKLLFGRTNNPDRPNGFPLKYKVEFKQNGSDVWQYIQNLDIPEVEPGQTTTIDFVIKPTYDQIKFTVLENIGDYTFTPRYGSFMGQNLKCLVLGEFQIIGNVKVPIREIPELGVQYPLPNRAILSQEFFRENLYNPLFKDIKEYVHTHGVVDHNADNNFEADETPNGWIDKNIWNEDGTLKDGVDIPQIEGKPLLELPRFDFEAPVNVVNAVDTKGRKRQPTTTVKHNVYVIPGERVDLIPYSDIWQTSLYMEDFYRWYNYTKKVVDEKQSHDDIYFLMNPQAATYSEKFGLFGGRALGYPNYGNNNNNPFGYFDWESAGRGAGAIASFYRPIEDGKTLDDTDYINDWIAADFSQDYYVDDNAHSRPSTSAESKAARLKDVNNFIDLENGRIIEPIINFRHLFHVIDGRIVADSISGSKELNDHHVKMTRRYTTARKGADFKIRLQHPMPVASKGEKSDLYYYDHKLHKYRRMGQYEIKTYRYDEKAPGNLGEEITDGFTPYERSRYQTMNCDMVTNLNPDGTNTDAWIASGKEFYRAIGWKSPEAGRYVVRLIGKDVDGDIITLEDGSPLIVKEHVVNFLSKDKASLGREGEIPDTHKSKYLDEHFGTPEFIDFDKYGAFEQLSNWQDYLYASGNGKRIKYPAPWMNSSYIFGYKYSQDYSSYTIASHADVLPYAHAALDDETNGEPYDRTWYETENDPNQQQGYFLYVNAASDPGEVAKIPITQLCVGSTIHISAWINQMSVYTDSTHPDRVNEPANIIFIIRAVMKDGNEVDIQSFSTGYIQQKDYGKWVHAYFSATPNFEEVQGGKFDVSQVERMEVIVENNCINSYGADYAIDDIRIYVANPKVDATQTEAYCGGESTKQRFDLPFNTLLSSLGEVVATSADKGKEITLYYSVFDKGKYISLKKELDNNNEGDIKSVLEGSVLTYKYDGENETSWGSVKFNTHYDSNKEQDGVLGSNNTFKYTKDGVDCISFIVEPTSPDMASGKTYVAAIISQDNVSSDVTIEDFDISNNCQKQAEFTVKGSNLIRVDGVVQGNTEDIFRCENQFPVVQVDIYGIRSDDNQPLPLFPCALLDWFEGSMAEFEDASFEGTNLLEALLNFRTVYPYATDIDQEIGKIGDGNTQYTETYKKTLSHFINNKVNENRLIIGSKSYMFDSRVLDDKDEVEVPVVAIPANRSSLVTVDDTDYLVCCNPTELTLHVDKRAPSLLDGLNVDDFYPEGMKDVPVRAGLKHLMPMPNKQSQTLTVPLRGISIVTNAATNLSIPKNDAVYLVKTDDELLSDLTTDLDVENGAGLIQVGTITDINDATREGAVPTATIVFDQNFNFREGYFYTVRFNYTEKTDGDGEDDPDAPVGANDVCDGQTIFTIKVVPEYQMWTGEADNLNWNNDANWRRVTSAELLLTEESKVAKNIFVTDGTKDGKPVNERTKSFAPLDFTKVIIPAGKTYPGLYAIGKHLDEEINSKYPITGYTGTAGDKENPVWSKNPNPDKETIEATPDVQYDLVAYHPEGEAGFVNCRTWYANACEQIHFRPNSEMMGQQHLLYAKAWVDLEMNADRWYLAASPLQGVVAGDMYLPSVGARQMTELFQPIEFNTSLNDRFAPAVYQRGWDKGTANVYELPSSNTEKRNVAIALDWSHVYNDVAEQYAAGAGFSVKSDVSSDKVTGIDEKENASVLFRLPKNDDVYEYWDQNGEYHGPGNGNGIDSQRVNPYRLNSVGDESNPATVTLTNDGGNKYFLAGNPFMAHLDMKKFLEKNKASIEPKYWIMTANAQGAAIMDENGELVSTIDRAQTLAPMQGFFVEANASTRAGRELTLSFSPEMAINAEWSESDGTILKSATRTPSTPAMTVTPYDAKGSKGTPATVILSPAADKGYRDSEDVVLLNDYTNEAAKAFTIAGNKAVSINSLDNAEGLEIGVIAPDDAVSRLVFENVGNFDSYLLLDSSTGEISPLYEEMEIEVKGAASGRFFLITQSSAPEVELLGLRMTVNGQDVTIHAPNAETGISVTAFTVAGMTVANIECEGEATLTLEKGVYIISAQASDGTTLRRKIIL